MGSLLVAYALWLFGGLFGLQHLYLRRYFHAFAWLCTGGGLGLGWLWDLCELPFYVEEHSERSKLFKANHNRVLKPHCSTVRFIGQLILGSWLGFLAACALPYDIWPHHVGYPVAVLISSLGVGWGVYMVGNIGLQKRKFSSAIYGALVGCVTTMYVFGSANSMTWGAISSAIQCNKTAEWRKSPASNGVKIYLVSVALYTLLILAGISFNFRVTLEDGSNQSLAEICVDLWKEWRKAHPAPLHSLFQGDTDFVQLFEDFYTFLGVFFSSRSFANPYHSDQAFQTLGLRSTSSRSEIRSHCRKLLKETHPDTTGEKGTEEFIRIQKACESLAPRTHSRSREDL